MADLLTDPRLHIRLIDAFYVEAMVLADEARSYFDEGGRAEREALSPMDRVAFSCESLKVTTRLMHVIAWLLTQRAVIAGELTPAQAQDSARRLGTAPVSEEAIVSTLPEQARAMVAGSIDLHRRVERLDAAQVADGPRSERRRQPVQHRARAVRPRGGRRRSAAGTPIRTSLGESLRHPGLVPASTARRPREVFILRHGGLRNRSGVTEGSVFTRGRGGVS